MRLGIMQPYFLPYIGYWQLLSAVDAFVVYDNIQYTKKSWINRNRFLLNGHDSLFTIPLSKDSDLLDIHRRFLALDFRRDKLLGKLEGAYRKAPYFREILPLIAAVIEAEQRNLFDYVVNSLQAISAHLGITTPLIVSSTVAIDHSLRAEHKVLALCKALGADRYLNSIGGQELYSKLDFAAHGVALDFVRTRPVVYPQFTNGFVPNLSIVDVLMFNPPNRVRAMLSEYDLV